MMAGIGESIVKRIYLAPSTKDHGTDATRSSPRGAWQGRLLSLTTMIPTHGW
uniref:Uncharacterized protein n=1 Tax=Oryza barthii TaxID=65489 RepID=A0A0D3EME1_9ORYZ